MINRKFIGIKHYTGRKCSRTEDNVVASGRGEATPVRGSSASKHSVGRLSTGLKS